MYLIPTIMLRNIGFLLLMMIETPIPCHGTPLDDYVYKPDPTYTYFVIDKVRGPTYTSLTVNMTSQTWKPAIQSQPIWWHYLTIIIPDKVDKDAAFMFIAGGSNNHGPPSQNDKFLAVATIIAASTNSVAACLEQIPNQPIMFKDDPMKKRRTEDAIVAWTWKTFIENNGTDPEILLRLPMTKAAVRAMDTVQDISLKFANITVSRFVVAGASKRGWTTWTTAAVDKRVIAFAPIVMDLLSIVKNLHHFYRSLGGWSFQLNDYYKENFFGELDNPAVKLMADIVDPLAYSSRFINKPKYIVSAGGDGFFMVDDARYYFNQLAGQTYLRMIPNTAHEFAPQLAEYALMAFYLSVVTGTPLPKLTWKLEYTITGGKITLHTDLTPKTVDVYYARTVDGKRKDFRLFRGTPGKPLIPQINPVVWLSRDAMFMGNNTFVAECSNQKLGWTAFFIQVTFPGVDGSTLVFTTETLITPDTFPFPDCHGSECHGQLV